MHLAAIDIGSNAIRLLIKDTENPGFPVTIDHIYNNEYYERVPLKSGIDTFRYGGIQPHTEAILTEAMCRFKQLMNQYDVHLYRACATSAYRDAKNGSEVINRVNKTSGVEIEIIPGEEEARITRLSYIPPTLYKDDTFLFVDVGGGSTEISLLHENQTIYSHSFQIGSMRYVCGNQLKKEETLLDNKIAEIHHDNPSLHYIGVGGCVKFMKNYINGKHNSNTVKVAQMNEIYNQLKKLTPNQISRHYKLPLERADILTPASSIFLRIAHGIHAEEIIVPSIGVRNGIITELYNSAT